MRSILVASLLTGLITAVSAQQPDVATLVAAARQALGGDAALAAITSFTVDGSLQRTVQSFSTTARFDIACILPDRFLRSGRRPMGNGPLAGYEIQDFDGFDGTRPIRETVFPNSPFPVPQPPPTPFPSPTTPEEIAAAQERRLLGARRSFIEMGSALFISLPSVYGLHLTDAGKMPLANGQADAVEITRADGTKWQLLLDETTHRPLKLVWKAKPIVAFASTSTMTMRRGDPASARGEMPMPPPGDPTAGLADVTWEMTIGDYKTADGLTWPHRLTTTFDGRAWEDVRLGKFKLNPKIDPNIFERRK